jgi:hypothetical protein
MTEKLLDIANSEQRAGVVLKGHWLMQTELSQIHDEIAPRFQHALDAER